MIPIKICYHFSNCILDFTQRCKDFPYTSIRSGFVNPIVEMLLRGHNSTFVGKTPQVKSVSDDVLSKLDDVCLESLQKNESDVILMLYSMPTDKEDIKTGPVVDEVKVAMMSFYDFESGSAAKSYSLDSFLCFSKESIIIFIMLLLIFYCLMALPGNLFCKVDPIRKKHKNLVFFFYSYFAKNFQNWTGHSSHFISMLIVMLTLLSFWMNFYYSGEIKTEAVIVKKPNVIESYNDILDNSAITPIFPRFFDSVLTFKDAPESSLKAKVWKRVLEKGIDNCIYDVHGLERAVHAFGFVFNFTGVVIEYRQNVWALRYLVLEIIRNSEHKKVKALFKYDPIEQERLRTLLFNPHISKKSEKLLTRRVSLIRQSGMPIKLFENVAKLGMDVYVDGSNPDMSRDISPINEFFSENVILPDASIITPGFDYFRGLFVLTSLLFIVCLLVVFAENMLALFVSNLNVT